MSGALPAAGSSVQAGGSGLRRERAPASPCVGICLMDPATRQCRGCRRTIAEIAAWPEASPAEKHAILARIAARRAEAGDR